MKVLVVVDMQNDFIDGTLGTPEAQQIVEDVVKKIEDFSGDLICVTRDTHFSNYLETQEGKFLPILHCAEYTHGCHVKHEVASAIADAAVDRQIRVQRFDKSQFGSPELAEYLRQHGATEIEFIGLCTDVCVLSNAVLAKAFLPEAKIFVDAKCCAGTSVENHDVALKAMMRQQIYVKHWED